MSEREKGDVLFETDIDLQAGRVRVSPFVSPARHTMTADSLKPQRRGRRRLPKQEARREVGKRSNIKAQVYPEEHVQAVAGPILDGLREMYPCAVQMPAEFGGGDLDEALEFFHNTRGATPRRVSREIIKQLGEAGLHFGNRDNRRIWKFFEDRVREMWPEEG